VQLAAERGGAAVGDRLATAVDALGGLVDGEFAAFRRADAAFHLLLAEASGNPAIVGAMTRLHSKVSDLFSTIGHPGGERGHVVRQHAEVADAVRTGDAPAAVAAMRAHLDTTERMVEGDAEARATAA
jgi:DNA-binding GntR family transcriptional regulator